MNTKTIRRKVKVSSLGLMDGSTTVSGAMVASMERALSTTKRVVKWLVNGRTVRKSDDEERNSFYAITKKISKTMLIRLTVVMLVMLVSVGEEVQWQSGFDFTINDLKSLERTSSYPVHLVKEILFPRVFDEYQHPQQLA